MTPSLPRVLLLWLVGLFAAGQFAKIGIPFAEVRALYPQAGEGVGWLLSLISLVGAVLGTVAGVLAHGLGLRRILLWGMALGAAVSALQALLPPLPVMLALRMIEGASHLAIVVAAPTLIAQSASPRWRGTAMALWSTFFGVAYALTAAFGLPLVAAQGVPALFVAHALGMAVLVGLVWALVPAGDEGARAALPDWRAVLARNRRAYGHPAIVAPGVGWLFYTLTFVSFLALLPDLLPPAQRAATVAAMPLVSIAVSMLLVPVLLVRLGGIGTVIAGFGLGAAVLAALAPGSLPVAAVALFAALGLVQGATFAAIPELNGASADDQAQAYGVMAQMGNLGNLTGTPLFLWVLGMGGAGAMLGLGAALYLVAIAGHLVLARRRHRVMPRA